MLAVILQSWAWLLYLDILMVFRSFATVRAVVQNQRTFAIKPAIRNRETICRAVDFACVFYFKHVLCLQRSAVTVVLLRRRGFEAELVIGAQLLPFQSHAWVEIQGEVVNDKPYINTVFQVLDRC